MKPLRNLAWVLSVLNAPLIAPLEAMVGSSLGVAAGTALSTTLAATVGARFAEAAPVAETTRSGPLRFRITGDPTTLDWNLAQTSHETYIIMNVMEGLVEEGTDLKPHPALAESWELSKDGLTYTFKLRAGVKWSDGRALRAQDFVDSWIRLLNPKTGASYANYLMDVENAEAFHAGKIKDAAQVGVHAQGDDVLVVKLRRRVPYFLHIPTFWVTFPIRADLVKKNGKDWATPGKIATLGPYLLKDWQKGKSLRMEANPAYRSVPAVREVEAVVEEDEQKARALFIVGKLDFLLNATTEDLLMAKSQQDTARVERYPYLATYYLGFNVRRPALGDAGVRKALASVLDRAALPSLLQGGQEVAASFVPDGFEGYSPAGYEPLSLYDARGALARAGHTEGRGFPRLKLWVEKMDGSDALAQMIVNSMHDKLGVVVEPRSGSGSEFLSALRAGETDLFVRHWGADYPEPSNFLEVFTAGNGNNFTGWSSGEYDAMLARARDASDAKQRVDAYAAAERLLVGKEQVIAPLFRRKNTVLLGPRVKRFMISPLNYLFLRDVALR